MCFQESSSATRSGADQALTLEEGEDLALEQSLCDTRIHEGYGRKRSSRVQPPRVTRAWTCGCGLTRSPKLWMTATMPGRRSGSSTAAAIRSRTVSQARRGEVPAQVAHLEEQWAEHLRDGENPLCVADVLLDVIDQEGAELGATLGGAGGAEAALLAREGDQHLMATGVAADAGEAVVPDATVEVAGDRLVPEAAEEPVAGFEALQR